MSASQFGGGGEGGGGGYLSQQSPGGFGSPGGERKANAHAIRPVNIAQIHAATQGNSGEGEFVLDGVPLTMVTIVAQVMSVTSQITADVFKLQDGSGEIDARHWVEARSGVDDDRADDTVYQDKFVRFTGSIRAFQNRRHINAQIIRVLEDQNEAFFHFNDVMAVTLYHRHGTPKELQEGGSATYAKASVSNYHQSATSYIKNDQFDDLPPIQRAVLEYMRANKPISEEGHHVRTLAKGVLRVTKEPADVAEAIDKLGEQGLIFSTGDPNHYALVD